MNYQIIFISFILLIITSNSTQSCIMKKLTGTITFDGDRNIAANSIATVKIIDCSRADAASKTIGNFIFYNLSNN